MPRKKKQTTPPPSTTCDENDSSKKNVSPAESDEGGSKTSLDSPRRSPRKRTGAAINVMAGSTGRKKSRSKDGVNTTMRVEGYAFQDGIVGNVHIRSDGEDAYNLNLRNMIRAGDLKQKGFHVIVTLRDKASGKDDYHLRGADGYPRYMFLDISRPEFADNNEAAAAVEDQCRKLHDVSTNRIFFLV